MTQNTSHAVMAQRHEAHDSLDHFPTPPWATRALCEWLGRGVFEKYSVWEPACAEGYMSRPLAEYFAKVHSSDVHDYGFGEVQDFLWPAATLPSFGRPDFVITNPPFRLGEEFAKVALSRSNIGCALLVRTAFLESASRFDGLFSKTPPSDILQFVERVPMQKGLLNRFGSTATAYCWLVWFKSRRHYGTQFHWLAPCRKRLERDSDYPAASEAA